MTIMWSSLILWMCAVIVHLTGSTQSQQSASGWEPYGHHEFKFFNTKMTWKDAEAACINQRAHLASVHSLPEYQFIKHIISKQAREDVLTWLGGFNFATGDWWYWTDHTPFDFSYWAPGQPDGSGPCMQMNYKGGMDDWVCTDKRPFVCTRPYREGLRSSLSGTQYNGEYTTAGSDFGHDEIPPALDPKPTPKFYSAQPPTLGSSQSQQCGSGWEQYGHHEFKFFNTKMTWKDAEAACINQRANLASVHSLPEYQFVMHIIWKQAREDVLTWLGGFNFATGDWWYWTDHTPFDFSYWAPGQPDGSGPCMQMNYKGGMDDLVCTDKRPFVCTRPYRGVLKSSLSGTQYNGAP